MAMPRKRDYRQHAHANPYSDHLPYPKSPNDVNWAQIFNTSIDSQVSPDMLDLGCGYGAFLLFLAKKYPSKYIVGIEIRTKVYKYVVEKIRCLRATSALINNVAVVQANGMLFYLNYFKKAQLEKIFCLFPDPHFKKRKQRTRIICRQMLDQMAYTLKDHGRIYVSTDVKDLFDSMVIALEQHPLFTKADENTDSLFKAIATETDESRRAGSKVEKIFAAIYERVESHPK
ncbi:tRNA (guanine-N(7)-)-methyltransferase [Dictyocoela roeselum]|nr:tRNA (guanine-N(7)-)-methyltransferase [Dictyocoela roeselum]